MSVLESLMEHHEMTVSAKDCKVTDCPIHPTPANSERGTVGEERCDPSMGECLAHTVLRDGEIKTEPGCDSPSNAAPAPPEERTEERKWVDGNGKVFDSVMDVPALALSALVRGVLRGSKCGIEPFEALDALMVLAAEKQAPTPTPAPPVEEVVEKLRDLAAESTQPSYMGDKEYLQCGMKAEHGTYVDALALIAQQGKEIERLKDGWEKTRVDAIATNKLLAAELEKGIAIKAKLTAAREGLEDMKEEMAFLRSDSPGLVDHLLEMLTKVLATITEAKANTEET